MQDDPPPSPRPQPAKDETPPAAGRPPVEIGGRDGPDPTRYKDWEKGGRCIDF